MNWQNIELGEMLTLQRGYDLPSQSRLPGNVPIVSSSGITSFHNKAKEASPGVVTGRYGTIGEVFYLSEAYWPLNTTLFVKDFKGNNPKFISYLLECLNLKEMNSAGAVPGVNRNHLHKVKIKAPTSRLYQDKLVSLVSAYDDLIENNLKRIKLLEEMAQITYEEWFVRMKFPGHESAAIDSETGLPEGWSLLPLTEAIQVNPSTKVGKALAPFVPMGALSTSSMLIEGIESRIPSGGARFINGDTLVARITPCLENGKTGFVNFLTDSAVATGSTEFIVLRETDHINRYFIYCLARSEYFRDFSIQSMVGTDGRQRVNHKAYEKFLLKQPPLKVMRKFEKSMRPCFDVAKSLLAQNKLLREARDILLPRLMTGMIDIDQVEVPEVLLQRVSQTETKEAQHGHSNPN